MEVMEERGLICTLLVTPSHYTTDGGLSVVGARVRGPCDFALVLKGLTLNLANLSPVVDLRDFNG